MNRLASASFFLAMFLGPAAHLFGDEECYRLIPGTQQVLTTVWEPSVDTRIVSTVFRPLRVVEGVVSPEKPLAESSIRPASDLVVYKPAIPLSAPTPEEESAPPTLTPPPPMPLDDAKISLFAQESLSTFRGQAPGFKSALDEAMSTRPPLPQGQIGDPAAIPEPLTQPPTVVEPITTVEETDLAASGLKAKRWTNGVLLLVTVIALGSLFYFIAIAFDYRQRWMQSLISQNNRLTPNLDDAVLGGFGYSDDGDFYGGPRFQSFGTDPRER